MSSEYASAVSTENKNKKYDFSQTPIDPGWGTYTNPIFPSTEESIFHPDIPTRHTFQYRSYGGHYWTLPQIRLEKYLPRLTVGNFFVWGESEQKGSVVRYGNVWMGEEVGWITRTAAFPKGHADGDLPPYRVAEDPSYPPQAHSNELEYDWPDVPDT